MKRGTTVIIRNHQRLNGLSAKVVAMRASHPMGRNTGAIVELKTVEGDLPLFLGLEQMTPVGLFDTHKGDASAPPLQATTQRRAPT